jgi:restriction system protein
MAIWIHSDTSDFISSEIFGSTKCLYCNSNLDFLKTLYGEYFHGEEFSPKSEEYLIKIAVCPICGWWKVHEIHVDDEHLDFYDMPGASVRRSHIEYGAIGSLRELDIKDLHQPIEAVRQYLAAKYNKRFQVHPKLFEETVASVFRDLNYKARVTAYSGDDGIDIILDGPDDSLIGVQVKRYKNTIKVEQIRSLAGALLIGGYTKGIFVTTSFFQPGAKRTVDLSALRGIPIELINATDFYDALQIAQRNRYTMNDNDAPFFNIPSSKLIRL